MSDGGLVGRQHRPDSMHNSRGFNSINMLCMQSSARVQLIGQTLLLAAVLH
jgi:hypothetical protein